MDKFQAIDIGVAADHARAWFREQNRYREENGLPPTFSEEQIDFIGPALYRATAGTGLIFVDSKEFAKARVLKDGLMLFLQEESEDYTEGVQK